MILSSKKISETQIEITKQPATPEPIVNVYGRAFIEQQIISIIQQRDEMIALKEAELKECTDILSEMDKKGVIASINEEPK